MILPFSLLLPPFILVFSFLYCIFFFILSFFPFLSPFSSSFFPSLIFPLFLLEFSPRRLLGGRSAHPLHGYATDLSHPPIIQHKSQSGCPKKELFKLAKCRSNAHWACMLGVSALCVVHLNVYDLNCDHSKVSHYTLNQF